MPPRIDCALPKSFFANTNDAITIYNSEYRLIAWNEQYADLGITPRNDIVDGLHLADTYVLASRLGVFGSGNPDAIAQKRIDEAFEHRSPSSELLNTLSGGSIFVRRFFLPGIGVAAVFSNSSRWSRLQEAELNRFRTDVAKQTERECRHDFNNKLCVIANTIALANMTGDFDLLNRLDFFGNKVTNTTETESIAQENRGNQDSSSRQLDCKLQSKNARVLLVEDEIDVAVSTRALFAEMGFQAISVRSGSDAINLVAMIGDQLDIVLSDFRLEGTCNGMDVLRYVKSEQPELPFVLCSATPEECTNIGNTPLLQKPVIWQELRQLISLLI